MKSFVLSMCLLALAIPMKAQTKFAAKLIPDSLKTDANVVIRESLTSYTRLSIDHYKERNYRVITILNPKGDSYAEISIPYDDNSNVLSFEAFIYDEDGQELDKIKKRDLEDVAVNYSSTMMSDNRMLQYEPNINSYPYTIAFEYEVDNKSLMTFGNWIPSEYFNVALEKAELVVNTPTEFELRSKSLNYDFETEISNHDGVNTYRWKAENIAAVKRYRNRPPRYLSFPVVMLMPNRFSYDGFEGDFSNWHNYGRWVHQLLEGRDELPQETIDEIQQLVANAPDDREKVKRLYRYLQEKTRYVSIQYGIGGFQPFEASYVDQKSYGDCKALSNYMVTLLKQVGIKAYYAEIGSGLNQNILFPDFATATQTNHVITCVPLENDTIWLECTNQRFPFNYLGTSNSDRYALLITDDGGQLAKTPCYPQPLNKRNLNINFQLHESGACEFESTADFTNYLYEYVFSLLNMSADDQKKALLEGLDSKGIELSELELNDVSDTIARATVALKGKLSGICAKAGNRLLVTPGFLYSNFYPKDLSLKRTVNFYEANGYVYNDSLRLALPEDYELEFLPKDASFENKFGSCSYHYEQADGQLLVKREVSINKGEYTPDEFLMLNLFFAFCDKMDHNRIVLKKS